MYVIRVVPLVSLPPGAPQSLDYFWSSPLPRGAVVKAAIGRRAVSAIVISCDDVRRSKLAVKRAGFQLKPLSGVLVATAQATECQLAFASWLAQHYATGLSTALRSVLPSFIGSRNAVLDLSPAEPVDASPGAARMMLLRATDALAETARIVAATHTGQIAVIVPEIALVPVFRHALAAHDPVVVHSGLSARHLLAAHRAVASGDARLIIGTRVALGLPFRSLQHLIVEDPQHEAYKSDRAPRSNAPDAAREVARLAGASLTYLASSASVVQQYLGERGVLAMEDRRPTRPPVTVVDMQAERADGNRSLLSRAAQDALVRAAAAREPVLVFSARRAYATAVRCAVCEATVPCTTCGIPLRMHRTTEDLLVCYHCGAFRTLPQRCPACRHGVLRPAGRAGSQRIAETVGRFIGQRVPILDSDLVREEADADAVWAAVDAMDAPVLVASQMIFRYRFGRTFPLVIVPQADALGDDADFRATERALWQLEKLLDLSPRVLVVQSWDLASIPAVDDADALARWYRAELDDRRALGWPPFVRVVTCTVSGRSRARAARDAAVVAERLRRAVAHEGLTATQVIGPVAAFLEHAAGVWRHRILVKTSASGPRLARLLSYVPSPAVVDVDPRSVA